MYSLSFGMVKISILWMFEGCMQEEGEPMRATFKTWSPVKWRS
jgi:hypothetical protein